MNISKKLLAAAILAAASTSAFAAEKGNEVSIFGSIINQSTPASSTTTIVNASYGRYLMERLAITGSATILDAGSTKMTTLGVGAKYYFKSGKQGDFVPFVAGSVNVGSIDATTTTVNPFTGVSSTNTSTGATFGIRAGGGASYFLSETASIDGRLELVAGTMTVGGVSSNTSSTELTVGITQRF